MTAALWPFLPAERLPAFPAYPILSAKGFGNAIVSIGEGSVDVIVDKEELTDVERAQIEDIIVRKTNCTIDQIVITSVVE